jgi:hypothetical protein
LGGQTGGTAPGIKVFLLLFLQKKKVLSSFSEEKEAKGLLLSCGLTSVDFDRRIGRPW